MEVVMPKVGLTMTEGAITEWHKREGEPVRRGELLFTFETEKSTLEYESPEEGVIARILVPVGQTVACFTPVAVVVEARQAGEPQAAAPRARAIDGATALRSEVPIREPVSTSPWPPAGERAPASPRAKLRARELGVDLAAVAGSGPDGALRARDVEAAQRNASLSAPPARAGVPTPLAARLAAELGIDARAIEGTGPDGKVTRADVERAARRREVASAAGERDADAGARQMNGGEVVPRSAPASLTPARRVTAQRMAANAQSAPHVTLMTEVDATELVSARNQLNAELKDKISYNALLAAMCARALKEHPGVNASWVVGPPAGVVQHDHVNIGVAVDTPRGLFVPVLKGCGGKPLAQIHAELSDLVARTTDGRARPDELGGGTFTITNLGMFEIDAFTPIINLPEAAILGVGRIVTKPAAAGDQVALRQMMTLSLSFDHRVVDGAPAARFLQRVKQLIERPFALML